jgi:transcriptional regulator with XRE-family HTH domain
VRHQDPPVPGAPHAAGPDDEPSTDDDVIPVPWFATPVPPGHGYPALRPVPEDEIEELDELPPWYPNMPEPPPAERPGGRAEACALVALAAGRAIRARRRELRLSQAAYGRRTGRTQGTVSRLERGRLALTVSDVVRIALETGRSIRMDVVPDDAARGNAGRRDQMRLGHAGSVRVQVGPAPPPGSAERGPRRIP